MNSVPCFSLVLVRWNCVHLLSSMSVLNLRETTWNSGQMELNNPTCIWIELLLLLCISLRHPAVLFLYYTNRISITNHQEGEAFDSRTPFLLALSHPTTFCYPIIIENPVLGAVWIYKASSFRHYGTSFRCEIRILNMEFIILGRRAWLHWFQPVKISAPKIEPCVFLSLHLEKLGFACRNDVE